jgi:4-amino-4-deoxy-L-arabinose transferase-like glycosyltransferase
VSEDQPSWIYIVVAIGGGCCILIAIAAIVFFLRRGKNNDEKGKQLTRFLGIVLQSAFCSCASK